MLNQASAHRFERGCLLPLIHGGEVLGVLFLGTADAREVEKFELGRWQELAQFVAAALWNALRYDELTSSTKGWPTSGTIYKNRFAGITASRR